MSTAPALAKQAEPKSQSPAGLFSSPDKQTFVLSLLLVVFTLALYNQVNHFSFVSFDDDRYVYENTHVRAGLTADTIRWALTSTDEANWHPLTWMSHALDYQLFHLNPAGHHLTSVLFHAINAVLLFLLLWRGTRKLGPSFFVAAIFVVHPVNAESVAWVAERKNVLSTMFFLLTLGAYGWYAMSPGWKRYLAVAGLLICGLASKPMLVTLPFVLLLLDIWPLQRIQGWSEPSETLAVRQTTAGKLLLEKLPLLAVVCASALITMAAQRAAGAVGTVPYPIGVRLKNAVYCYAMYVWKAVWPTHLAPFYPHPGQSLTAWKAGVAALFLIAATSLIWKFRSRGYLVTGWLWFLGTLVPVIGLVQVGNQAMADRYAYIPFIGLFVMIAWSAADLAEAKKFGFILRVVPAICAVVALSLVSYQQIGYWRNNVDLWSHTLQVTTANYVAEDSLGAALTQLNRVDDAFPHFVRAAEIKPNDPAARLNIGTYLYQHGRIAEAVSQYKLAIFLTTDIRLRAAAYANLGSAYRDLGDDANAEDCYAQSVRLNSRQGNAWLGLALLAQKQGKMEASVNDLANWVQLQPSAEGFAQLGRTLLQVNRRSEALSAYAQALKMDPQMSEAQQAVNALLREQH